MGRPRKYTDNDGIITTPLGEVSDSIDAEPVEVVEEPTKTKYATEYFKKNGLPYCETCGAQWQSDVNNNPICPERLTECPRLKPE